MQVILSVPIPSSVFGARIFARIAATASESLVGPLETSIFSYIKAQASSFERQSQIPSHAKIINLSSFVLFVSVISGLQVTAYFSTGRPG
jgi:hypothetical protein